MADYGSSGIWVDEPIGPFRHGMITHRRLGLPAELAAQFAAWIDKYWARSGRRPLDVPSFNAQGRSFAVELKRFVGAETTVLYEPELEDGELGPPEVIEVTESGIQ